VSVYDVPSTVTKDLSNVFVHKCTAKELKHAEE
jgi:hypothetical protein